MKTLFLQRLLLTSLLSTMSAFLAPVSFGADAPTSSSSSGSGGGSTITTENNFVNVPITNQTGTFTATFSASASVSPSNSTLSFSSGPKSAYAGLAAAIRFSTAGTIDARNGGTYAAVSNIPFTANTTYNFRMVINVAARTYSAFVTPPGGSELTIATDYAFRSEQASITNIDTFNANVNRNPGGSLTYTAPVIK